MSRALRWLGYLVAALLVLLLLAAAWLWFASNRALNAPVTSRAERLVQPTPAALPERRARTLGCISCHSEGLSGKPFLDDAKVARLHATNLTDVAARASDQQLARAIRQGIGIDGRALLVMPSEAYQYLTDAETAALIAFIRRQPRAGAPSPPRSLGPLARLGIATGRFRTTPVLAASGPRPTSARRPPPAATSP